MNFALAYCLVLLLCGSGAAARKALIFDRPPHACVGCPGAMEDMLKHCGWQDSELDRLGGEDVVIDANLLKGYDLYVQPGGDSPNNGKSAFQSNEIRAIKKWVSNGGHYYGSCWGGYAAGNWVFGFIKAGFQPERFVNDAIPENPSWEGEVPITWLGDPYYCYFQDGPTWFLNKKQERDVDVLATYTTSDNIAVMVFEYGSGKVGVTGVHLEGSSDDTWIKQYDLGCELLDMIMEE